jgi:hypothetical protein
MDSSKVISAGARPVGKSDSLVLHTFAHFDVRPVEIKSSTWQKVRSIQEIAIARAFKREKRREIQLETGKVSQWVCIGTAARYGTGRW